MSRPGNKLRATDTTIAEAIRQHDAEGTAELAQGNLPAPGVGRPEPDWVRGICPECGDELVSNMYYTGGRGYLVVWECWKSLGENPTCGYRKVL